MGCSPWGCKRAGHNLATKEHTYVCVCVYIYMGCPGSLLLCSGFLQLWQAGATRQLQRSGFLLQWLPPTAWALGRVGSVAAAWELTVLWRVGSSRTRDQTCVPCVGRQFLNH